MVFGQKRVIKKILKKEDAVKSLSDRAKTIITKQFDDVEMSDDRMPRQLEALLNPIYGNINSVKEKMVSNTPFINETLTRLSDEQLNSLIDIFKTKGNTEPKIIQCAYVVLKDLDLIEKCLPFLYKARLDLLHCFTEAYSKEYSCAKGQEYIFDNEQFLRDLRATVSYRNGLMRAVEMNNNSANHPEQQEDNSCAIM
eukprot:Skav213862  [mRNA]  locus=scaffold2366:323210:323800:+ [translate_table: standard]